MSTIPSKDAIIAWISENPTQSSKRDIARAFGLKGAARIDLKRILRELEAEGRLAKRRTSYRDPNTLPPVCLLEVKGADRDGNLFAHPVEWSGEAPAPTILIELKQTDPGLGQGDRVLARLVKVSDEVFTYTAHLIRKIGNSSLRVMGIFRERSEGGRILPLDKGTDKEWIVNAGSTAGAKDGELVEAEQIGPKKRMGLPLAKIVARLGDPTGPRAVSLIAIHQHGIPNQFPDGALAEADRAKPAGLKGRADLRELPLITIDPSDARDHDDACCVLPDGNGGFYLWVAIADVAHYVTHGSQLDREAKKRGNSTYFPDRVVPMLPDRLSGDLCSLHEGVPRACIAVEMHIDQDGNKLSHKFHRGLMTSPASLNYEEVQAAIDGQVNDKVSPLLEGVIRPLYSCFEALKRARALRQPLDLDLPERKIDLDDDGNVRDVSFKERLDAHRLIEEFMILANVAAAETLGARRTPLLYRVHEEPSPEKLEALRETALASGLQLAKGQVLKTAHLNRLLAQAKDSDQAEIINIATLRSMTQAYYSPENFGHFGLALRAYAHFTSPIRRYADLVVHRALISAHGWGDDGLSPDDIETLADTATAISATERRSMIAERDTNDRYLAAFMQEKLGTFLQGRINGVANFGVFVRLDETGADGLIPMRHLGSEYFHFDREAQTLEGAETGQILTIGMRVSVKLIEAAPITGGLILELAEISGALPACPPKKGRGKRKPVRRKLTKSKKKSEKVSRQKHRRGR